MIPATPTATRTPGRYRCAPPAPPLVQDLHPHDRGPKGTCHGAIIANGNLYCPGTPRPLLELGPLARTATSQQAADHDRQTANWPATSSDASPPTTRTATTACSAPPPWARSAARCRHRFDDAGPRTIPKSCSPARTSPGLLRAADDHRPARTCSPRPRRNTTTRPRPGAAPIPAAPAPNAASPPPRTPPANDIARGWCRLMGLAPLMLFTTTLLIARNQRILAAWNTRQARKRQRRAAQGLPPRTRRRRRKTLTMPRRRRTALARQPPRSTHDSHPRTHHRQRQHARKLPQHTESHLEEHEIRAQCDKDSTQPCQPECQTQT